ncbi:CLUMA_CG006389, isoform A [Clunio marinus]|uniref:CLUMA_CG006389, isoform A n=1 Tax=Clunio marinus TaxID=568069 RepID=A0A1J1I351_9DIPT|nr:CLUMA_CG006389, isoform A [Clunio marinus]
MKAITQHQATCDLYSIGLDTREVENENGKRIFGSDLSLGGMKFISRVGDKSATMRLSNNINKFFSVENA